MAIAIGRDRPTAVAIPVGCCRGSASATEVALGCCATNAPLCAASAVAAAAADVGGGRRHRAVVETKATGDDVVVLRNNAGGQLEQQQQCKCPFFRALLREVDMCRDFFLENERALEVRTRRLQLGLEHLRRPDLSRLSTVKGAHMKLMKACVNFYRDALLMEDFAMLNYPAVIKLLKKRDKIAGTSDKLLFMAEVMADQPFAMYSGVAKRVVQVEQIFREIENMCFLRTGEGMTSVMKNELTVIEAFMQLAQESQGIQNRELDGGNLGGPPPPPALEARNEHQPCPSALISPQAIGVSWCEQSGGGAAASGAHGSGHGSPPAGTASSNSRDRIAATLQSTAAL